VIIRSCGVRGLEGEPASEGTVLEAARRGLDLSAHVGARWAEDRIRDADLVITMSQEQRDHVVAAVPGSGPKVFTIRELVRLLAYARTDKVGGTARERVGAAAASAHAARPLAERSTEREDVADPYGGPPEGYARMAAQLDRLVLALANDLFGPLPNVDADLFGSRGA
jgi:protein-tyrosine phosphatase